MKKRIFPILVAATISGLGGLLVGSNLKSVDSVVLEDLNGDGNADILVSDSLYKTPFFAVSDAQETRYLSAEQMKKEAMFWVDEYNIEAELNGWRTLDPNLQYGTGGGK